MNSHLASTQRLEPSIPPYIGRFAPSPTGPLHFGSLVAAVGSYLQAKTAHGAWLVRIEDLDAPRSIPGAADDILRTLERFGFEWDSAVEYQSRRLELYERALVILQNQNLIYPCSCSRSQLATSEESSYPGTCQVRGARTGEPVAKRFIVPPGSVEFVDALQGRFIQDVSATSGDFVVQRRDGIFAYHLAVVVDDADQNVTEIVRGADLLDSTPRHLLLQRALQVSIPTYSHLPLALDARAQKLSKSAQSIPVAAQQATAVLWQTLEFLRQSPPATLRTSTLNELWTWARASWNPARLINVTSSRAPNPE